MPDSQPVAASLARLPLFIHPTPIHDDVIPLLILRLRDDHFVMALFVAYRSLGEIAVMRLRYGSDPIRIHTIFHRVVEFRWTDLHDLDDESEDRDAR